MVKYQVLRRDNEHPLPTIDYHDEWPDTDMAAQVVHQIADDTIAIELKLLCPWLSLDEARGIVAGWHDA